MHKVLGWTICLDISRISLKCLYMLESVWICSSKENDCGNKRFLQKYIVKSTNTSLQYLNMIWENLHFT